MFRTSSIGLTLLASLLGVAVGCHDADSTPPTSLAADTHAERRTEDAGPHADTVHDDTGPDGESETSSQDSNDERSEPPYKLVLTGRAELPNGSLTCLKGRVVQPDGSPANVEASSATGSAVVDSANMEVGAAETCLRTEFDGELAASEFPVTVIGRNPGSAVVDVTYELPNRATSLRTSKFLTVSEKSVRTPGFNDPIVIGRVGNQRRVRMKKFLPSRFLGLGYYIPPGDLDLETADSSVATVRQTEGYWYLEAESVGTTELTGTYTSVSGETAQMEPTTVEVVDEERTLQGITLELSNPTGDASIEQKVLPPGECLEARVYASYGSEHRRPEKRPLGDVEAEWEVKTPETVEFESDPPVSKVCATQRGAIAFRAVSPEAPDERKMYFERFGAFHPDAVESASLVREGNGTMRYSRGDDRRSLCPTFQFHVRFRDGEEIEFASHPATKYRIDNKTDDPLSWSMSYGSAGGGLSNLEVQPCFHTYDSDKGGTLTVGAFVASPALVYGTVDIPWVP